MQNNNIKRMTRGAASTAICVALALGTVGVASAHDAPPSRHHADKSHNDRRSRSDRQRDHGGKVTAIGVNSVTIQRRDGATVTYTTTSTTTYSMGETSATMAALAVGEQVDVTTSSTAPQTATAIEVDLANVNGKVTAISGDTITVGSGSDAKTVIVDASTMFTLRGATSTLSAIVVGSRIETKGVSTSSSALNATSVKIELVRLETHAEGIVTALGTNSVTIQDGHESPITYMTTSSTTFSVGKTAATAAAVAVGEHVDVKLTSTAPQTVASVDVDLAKVEGKVTAINGNTVTLNSGSESKTVTVSASTTYTLGGAASTQSALVLGSNIEAQGVRTSDTALNAMSVKIELVRLATHAEGTITALGTNSVTIQDGHESPITYMTTSSTTFSVGKTAATAAAVAVGEHVDVKLTSTAPQTVASVDVDLAKVEGKVTAINGNTVTLNSGSESKTVTVSASTTYTLGGAASTQSALVLGSNIEAQGVRTSDTALNAMSVKIELVRLATHAEGTITALGTNSVTIEGRNGTPVTFTTTSSTTYAMGKTAATVAALAAGENVDLTLTATTPQTVTNVQVDLADTQGTVTAINGDTITLGNGSNAKTVTVGAATTYSLRGATSTVGAITVGSHIEAHGVWTSSSAFNAASVSIELNN